MAWALALRTRRAIPADKPHISEPYMERLSIADAVMTDRIANPSGNHRIRIAIGMVVTARASASGHP